MRVSSIITIISCLCYRAAPDHQQGRLHLFGLPSGKAALPRNEVSQPPKLAAIDNDWPREAGSRIMLAAKNPHCRNSAVPLPDLLAVQKNIVRAFGGDGGSGGNGV
jgi:hypothetical protein